MTIRSNPLDARTKIWISGCGVTINMAQYIVLSIRLKSHFAKVNWTHHGSCVLSITEGQAISLYEFLFMAAVV